MMLVLNGLNIINNAWVSSIYIFFFYAGMPRLEGLSDVTKHRTNLILLCAETSLLKQGHFCLWKSLTLQCASQNSS